MSDEPGTRDLPRPEDDGAARGVEGRAVPPLTLESTSGRPIDLARLAEGSLVAYVYPRTGVPGEPMPPGWEETPGAFGCTAESRAFRDHSACVRGLGFEIVGISSQPSEEQREFAAREGIPYPLLSDPDYLLAQELGLPTFEVAGVRSYRRLTFVAREGTIERVFYPVFPPDEHPAEVVAWLFLDPRFSLPCHG